MIRLWAKLTAASGAAVLACALVFTMAAPLARAPDALRWAAVFAAVSAALALYLRVFVKPVVSEITKSMKALEHEEFGRVFQTHNSDEIGGLAENINRLSLQLEIIRREWKREAERDCSLTVEHAVAVLDEANKQLSRTADDLKRLDKMKTGMSMVIYHDLRSPLAAIQSCINVVYEGIVGDLNPRQKDMLRRADEDIDKLLSLIADLLDLSLSQVDLDSASRDIRVLQPSAILNRIIEAYRTRAEQKNITIVGEVPPDLPAIKGDKVQIDQVFNNVVGNAVKYTRPGGDIHVAAKAEGRFIIVDVTDTGIGISNEDLPKIFSTFFRTSEAKDMEKIGTGLGLSIAKRVAEEHGGSIAVKSELGKGSTFTVRLPWMAE